MSYPNLLAKARSFSDIFMLVKRAANEHLGRDQAGLLVGLSDLGSHDNAFLGAFYSMDANTIVINKRPLKNIEKTSPELYNPYLFHVMLHEYLHSLGLFEEDEVKLLAYDVTKRCFGESHIATQMALDLEQFLPNMILGAEFEAPDDINIEFLPGIDKDNTDYIL